MDDSYEQQRTDSRKKKMIVTGTILGIIAFIILAIFLVVGLSAGSTDDEIEPGNNVQPTADEVKKAVSGKTNGDIPKPQGTVPGVDVAGKAKQESGKAPQPKLPPNHPGVGVPPSGHKQPAAPPAATNTTGNVSKKATPNPTETSKTTTTVKITTEKPGAGSKAAATPAARPASPKKPNVAAPAPPKPAEVPTGQANSSPPKPTSNGANAENTAPTKQATGTKSKKPRVARPPVTQVPPRPGTIALGTAEQPLPAAAAAAASAPTNEQTNPKPRQEISREATPAPTVEHPPPDEPGVPGPGPTSKPANDVETNENEGEGNDVDQGEEQIDPANPDAKVIYTRKSKYRIFVDDPKYDPDLTKVFQPNDDDINADFDSMWMMDYESIYDIKGDDFIFARTYGNSAVKEDVPPFRCIEFNHPHVNPEFKASEVKLSGTASYFHPQSRTDKFCKIKYHGWELTEDIENKNFVVIIVEKLHGIDLISLMGTDQNGTRSGLQFVMTYTGREEVRINNNYLHFMTAISRLMLTGNLAFKPNPI